MRIVWAAAAFMVGVGSAIIFGTAPGHGIPANAFAGFLAATILASLALITSRRRAAVFLLCMVFLIGAWRGADAIATLADSDQDQVVRTPSPFLVADSLNDVRNRIGINLNESLGRSHSGLPTALLTGDRSEVSDKVTRDFRSAGLAHLLAISGLHVSLIGGIAMTVAVMIFGRRRAFYLLIPLTAVVLYAAIAGFAPPVTRAAIMFAVFILGRSTGRGSHTLAALALAALCMVAIEPSILASLSFQLSFAAMLGIAFVAPVLDGFTEVAPTSGTQNERSVLTDRIRRFVIGSLAVSFASTLGTLPLVALHFDAVPIWGGLATLLAVPAMPILIISSAMLVALGMFPFPLVTEIAAIPVYATTTYITRIAEFFAYLPPKPIESGSWSVWLTVAYYSIFAALLPFLPQLNNFATRVGHSVSSISRIASDTTSRHLVASAAFTAIFLIIGIVFWSAILTQNHPKQYLSVRFLETSHGESTLIETPNGNRVLVDGGGDHTQVADILSGLLPLTDREIDVVVLTHTDADHVGGLPAVLERFPVGTALHSGLTASSDAFSSWENAIENHDDVRIAAPGLMIGLDEHVFLEVISAGCLNSTDSCSETNDASIVARLRYGDVDFLLTGDIERPAESFLVSTIPDLRMTVLKAPHHGSNTSSTQRLLDAVDPAVVVVAAGTGNRYGHPHPEVIRRLTAKVGEERVFRTDVLGTVELRTDGERLWMVR